MALQERTRRGVKVVVVLVLVLLQLAGACPRFTAHAAAVAVRSLRTAVVVASAGSSSGAGDRVEQVCGEGEKRLVALSKLRELVHAAARAALDTTR